MTIQTDILIVGAGPTGLMLANQLTRFDINFKIIDFKSGPTHESRALAVTARSMEIYQQMGVAGDILEQGKKINSLNLISKGKIAAEVNIGEIGKGLTDFSYMFAFEQSKNEELLYETLKKHNREVLWKTEFITLHDYGNQVISRAKHTETGEEQEIISKYVVGCDGARSPVRHLLNFAFKGGTYENKFIVADTVMDWDLSYDKIAVAPGDDNFVAFLPMYGEKNYRIIGTLPKSFLHKEDVTFEDIKDILLQTAKIPLTFKEVNWFSVYKLHHRCVDKFRIGNIFLAGDSAHIHSPAGGQGMNTGLQDAYNLGWKIAFVLKGYASEKLLITYNEERLPFAHWLLRFSDQGFNAMTNSNWFLRFFRRSIVFRLAKLFLGISFVRPRLFKTVSQLFYSYNGKRLSRNFSNQKLKFNAGDRFPYFNHQETPFYDRLKGNSFHLVHIGNNSFKEMDILSSLNFPVKFIEDNLDEKWQKLGVKSELFILVRPDNYIGMISDRLTEKQITYYKNQFY